MNQKMVRYPENVKLSQKARLIHQYRTERQSPVESMRQCRCHNDDYPAKMKDKYSIKGYEGIINLNQQNYLAFNSRPYNSIAALTDLRMKPQLAVDRTKRM